MDTRKTDQQAPDRRARRGSLIGGAALVSLLLVGVVGPATLAEEREATGFPVTLVDDTGAEVTIPSPPERIVSLSPANTEIVFALGAGDRLVGGTDFDDFPAAAVPLPDVATYNGLVRERLVDVEPDLVLAAGNGFTPDDDVAWLRGSGYPVVVVYAETVAAVLADIELIGRAIGERDEAAALTGRMSEQIDDAAATAAAMGSTPRTYYELDWFEGATYGPASESFVADMVALAGGEPVTTGDPVQFEMPLERLISADPEVIVLGDTSYGICPVDVAARTGWSDMTAVRDGAIRPVDNVPITRPGPRLAQGLASLARAIHPKIELPGLAAAPGPCDTPEP